MKSYKNASSVINEMNEQRPEPEKEKKWATELEYVNSVFKNRTYDVSQLRCLHVANIKDPIPGYHHTLQTPDMVPIFLERGYIIRPRLFGEEARIADDRAGGPTPIGNLYNSMDSQGGLIEMIIPEEVYFKMEQEFDKQFLQPKHNKYKQRINPKSATDQQELTSKQREVSIRL